MAETYKIKGGNALKGTIVPVPNKNAILATLPACILTDADVIYKNLPNTTDVNKILEIISLLGGNIIRKETETIINCKNINSYEVNQELGNVMRASILFAGPLLARFGKARIPLPGGCVLGKRAIHAHIDAFSKAGVTTHITNEWAEFSVAKKPDENTFIWMVEASVTATENLITYLAGTEGTFEVYNCASEPHVGQLLELLQQMGTDIQGINSNKLIIKGKKNLSGGTFEPDPDFVDVSGLISAAGLTHGVIRIKNVNKPKLYGGIFQYYEKFNIKITPDGDDIIADGSGEIKIDPVESGIPMASEDLPKFKPEPWPGFPVDCLPAIVALSCKLNGRILIMNWMYETGLDFIRELNAIGANIFMADPLRVIVSGPCKFTGGKVTSPGIIQACYAIFLAALADPVETTLVNADVLKRRYPDIISTYKALGANIEIVS